MSPPTTESNWSKWDVHTAFRCRSLLETWAKRLLACAASADWIPWSRCCAVSFQTVTHGLASSSSAFIVCTVFTAKTHCSWYMSRCSSLSSLTLWSWHGPQHHSSKLHVHSLTRGWLEPYGSAVSPVYHSGLHACADLKNDCFVCFIKSMYYMLNNFITNNTPKLMRQSKAEYFSAHEVGHCTITSHHYIK